MNIKSIIPKGLLMSLVVALAAIYAAPVGAQEYDDMDENIVYSVAADGKVNIRQRPSADAPIVGQLLTGGAGAFVDALNSSGIWYKVTYGDITGYVNALYVSGDRNADRVPNAKAKRTVYYVVIGSYESLEAVKKARYSMPDGIDCSPIFKGVKNGKTVYRMCSGVHDNIAAAKTEVAQLKDVFGFNPWIWTSKGQAECVDRPIGYNGKPVSITPDD